MLSMQRASGAGRGLTELMLEVFRLNGRLLTAGDRLARPFGQTSARWQILGALEAEPRTVSDIARIMGLTRQSVQRTADRLQRQIVQISSSSVAAREAQLSRRAELENVVAQAFALRCRIAPGDDVTPRLLLGLTLTILDVTFRVWAKRSEADIVAIADDVFITLTGLVSDERRPTHKRRRARLRGSR
jgi:DNA-binding MarR family transcriptional regulator